MTLEEAEKILEAWRDGLEGYAESLAEAGSGAVSLGYDGYDGVAEYVAYHPAPTKDAEVLEAEAVCRAAYPPVAPQLASTEPDDLPF